jgi:ketosteroid isomerase-like protein
MQQSSKIILSVIAAIVLVLIGLKLSAPNSVSDTEQIDQQLITAANSACNRDVEGIMTVFSDGYQDSDGNNPERMNMMLRREFSNVQNVTVSLSTINVTVQGDEATSTCHVTIRGDGQSVFDGPITLGWQREATRRYLVIPDKTWRVTRSSFTGWDGI